MARTPLEGLPVLDLTELPDLSAFTHVLLGAAETAASALEGLTERDVADGTHAVLNRAISVLEQVEGALGQFPEGADTLAETLSERTRADAHGAQPVLSKEELLSLLRALLNLLSDASAALRAVRQEEIQDVVEVGLPLAQGLADAARQAAAGAHQRVRKEHLAVSSVRVEELDDSGRVLALAPEGALDPVVTLRRPRRYLWRPLWPQLRDYVGAKLQAAEPAAVVMERPATVAAAAVCGAALAPPAVACVASALCADAVLQKAFQWKGDELEELIDGAVQTTNFTFRLSRFGARCSLRVIRAQAVRLLDGRAPEQVAREAAAQCWRQPLGSALGAASGATSGAVRAAGWAAAMGSQAWRWSPQLQEWLGHAVLGRVD